MGRKSTLSMAMLNPKVERRAIPSPVEIFQAGLAELINRCGERYRRSGDWTGHGCPVVESWRLGLVGEEMQPE